MQEPQFQLENLPYFILKQITELLQIKDAFKLLLVSKDWNKVFTPVIWEDLDPSYTGSELKVMRKAFRKYGKYIKMLWIRDGKYIKYIPKHYRNATTMFITSKHYFLNLEKYKKLSLTELNYDGGMEPVLNQSGNEIFLCNTQLKQLLKNVTSLTTDKIDNYFIDFVLPNVPRNIKSMCLFSRDFEFESVELILTNFQNLQDLRLFIDLCQQDLHLFQNHMFKSLKTLYLSSFTSDDKFNINFNHFPALTKLHLDYVRNLYLHGISSLNFLELDFVDLKCINSFGNIAPKLRILILCNCKNMNSKVATSIFQLKELTDLEITYHYEIEYTLGIEEVFRKSQPNLISLQLQGLSLGTYFVQLLITKCPNLTYLSIFSCHFDLYSLYFNYRTKLDKRSLNLGEVYMKNCTGAYTFLIEYILDYCSNLFFLMVDPIPKLEWSYNKKLTLALNLHGCLD